MSPSTSALRSSHRRVVLVASTVGERDALTADADVLRDAGDRLTWVLPAGLQPPHEADAAVHPVARPREGVAGSVEAMFPPHPRALPELRFIHALLRDPDVAREVARADAALWPSGAPGTAVPDGLLVGPEATGRLDELVSRHLAEKAVDSAGLMEAGRRYAAAVGGARYAESMVSVLWRAEEGQIPWADIREAAARAMGDQKSPPEKRLRTALRLLFHRRLHADGLSSPLVEDPGAWLTPLGSSGLWRQLTAERPRPVVATLPPGDRPRVVLLPGTYGRFEQPVVQALEAAGCTVDLLDLTEFHPVLTQRTVTPENIAAVRSLIEDGDHGLPPEVVDRLAAADVIWAEWADPPAVWASHLAAAHQRVVVRLHSLDTLDPWLHLVRWASVDAVVAVGAPVARVARAALGPRTDLPPVHVIGHVLDDRWSSVPATDDAHRRLVMVKWGRRVKDPLRAVEILARLREHDPAWRLRLIGQDLRESGESGPYTEAFARRIEADDVTGALEFVEQTDDVASHLSGCGFVLSTSRRESFHLGLVEGAAAGCVPVVRDWPVFARWGGARDVLPDEWVPVEEDDGIEGAVQRILEVSDRSAWEAASARARRQAREAFPAEETLRRLSEVGLGRVGS